MTSLCHSSFEVCCLDQWKCSVGWSGCNSIFVHRNNHRTLWALSRAYLKLICQVDKHNLRFRVGFFTLPTFCFLTLHACLQNIPLSWKAGAGLTAGGLGSLIGTPADLALIRMQADNTMPPEKRRNYKGVFDALLRCHHEQPGANSAVEMRTKIC